MSAISKKLRDTEHGFLFWCPGCDAPHRVPVGEGPGPRWSWNGSAERPTFSPSLLVRYDGANADIPGGLPSICHSFVTDGRIAFCGDSTHALSGQTVDIPDFDAP